MNPNAADLKWIAHFTMGFDSSEKEELLAILPPKYAQRVRDAHGFLSIAPESYALIDNGQLPSGIRNTLPL